MEILSWSVGHWSTEPVSASSDGTDLLVEAAPGSDAWRLTSYGFIRNTEHALLTPLGDLQAMEVVFTAAFAAQFDQTGIFLRVDERCWVKAGVEFVDGVCQVGAVVTNPLSDWSVAPVADWLGHRVRIRLSRNANAVTIRAGLDGQPLALVRVLPFPEGQAVVAGPFVCAPTRGGLTVRFHTWNLGPADQTLHP